MTMNNSLTNQIKTLILLITFGLTLGLIGFSLAGPLGLLVTLPMGLLIGLWFVGRADSFIANQFETVSLNARTKQGRALKALITECAEKLDIPTPPILVIKSNYPIIAIAGKSAHTSSLGISQSLIDLLDEKQLGAVITHHMIALKTRAVLLNTVATSLALLIAHGADFFRWTLYWRTHRPDRRRQAGGLSRFMIVMITPLAALITRVTRQRIYNSPHDNKKLVEARKLLENHLEQTNPIAHSTAEAVRATLSIVYPFHRSREYGLFDTHHPIRQTKA